MADNLEIPNAAVSLLIRAALLAARFSGRAIRKHGAPKHPISDQAAVFVGDVFAETRTTAYRLKTAA